MVKKFLSVFAVSSMIFATSCSNEDFVSPVTSGESLVSFTAQLPEGLNSRSYGNGETATKLHYQAYEVNNSVWAPVDDLKGDADIHGQTDVQLRLANGKTYKVVFWASAEGAPYTFDADDMSVSVTYTGIHSNNESLDAFYAVESITVTESASKRVELHRPFAQLNIGTADIEAYRDAGYSVSETGVTVSAVYDKFSFTTENVVGDSHPQTFSATTIASGDFPVLDYEYLAMNYLLVSKDKETVDVTLNYGGAVNPTYANVPVQRNYRTNIYGKLLTSQEDFTVVIVPDFEEPDYGVSVWDGTTSELPAFDALGECHITSASQLAQLMKVTANGNSLYRGKTFVLDTDISFANQTITGIGSASSNIVFTFDGNGHTISDFKIGSTNEWYAGLFQQFNGTVKNLTVKNATVKGKKMVGVIASNVEAGGLIDKCTVENCTVYSAIKKAGAITGYTASGTVTNCVAKNVDVYCADADVNESGEIVGYINTGSTVELNTATNVNVYRSTLTAATDVEYRNAMTSGNAGDEVAIIMASNSTFAIADGSNNGDTNKRDIIFVGDGTQTIDIVSGAVSAEGGKLNYQRGSSFTFKNMTIQAGEGDFDGIVCNEATYINCVIKGKITLYGKATFIDCTFENTMANQYSIWTWGGTDVKFEDCVFNTNGKAILLYGYGPTYLTVTDCVFNDRNNGSVGKAAIEVGNDYNATYSIDAKRCTVNGFAINANGENTGSKLWANKNNMDAAHLSVTIDGTRVY